MWKVTGQYIYSNIVLGDYFQLLCYFRGKYCILNFTSFNYLTIILTICGLKLYSNETMNHVSWTITDQTTHDIYSEVKEWDKSPFVHLLICFSFPCCLPDYYFTYTVVNLCH